MDKKGVETDSNNLHENYFNNFSDEDKKIMIDNLETENRKLRLQILNNSKLIEMLKNNGQVPM